MSRLRRFAREVWVQSADARFGFSMALALMSVLALIHWAGIRWLGEEMMGRVLGGTAILFVVAVTVGAVIVFLAFLVSCWRDS